MDKKTGFVRYPRVEGPVRPVSERLGDYREVALHRDADERHRQAARCMDCGVPFCQQGCPLGNAIPDFNDLVYRERWESAYRVLSATNNFPEFTGRLCPAPCEPACVLSIGAEPVTIEEIEKEVAERAFAEGWVQPQPPRQRTGKLVAVVGSGPAGLAAAAQLNRIGHEVMVYEADDQLGGLLRYGIPDFKLEKGVIDRRLAVLEAEGIGFVTGVRIGKDRGWRDLRDQHDALVVAIGSRVPRDLDVPGRELDGVCFAMELLEGQNRRVAGEEVPSAIDAAGRTVVILGGGDTGSDCLGTILRQGAKAATQIELLQCPPLQRDSTNPWPQWPLLFRTSSSQAEGGDRRFGFRTTHLVGSAGRVRELHAVQVEVVEPQDGASQMRDVPGEKLVLQADLVVLAMGYLGPDATDLKTTLGVELDRQGRIAVDGEFATSVPGVFACGDASRGQSLVVWAISDGREAARAVDSWLSGRASKLPARGMDRPF